MKKRKASMEQHSFWTLKKREREVDAYLDDVTMNKKASHSLFTCSAIHVESENPKDETSAHKSVARHGNCTTRWLNDDSDDEDEQSGHRKCCLKIY